MHLLPRLIGTFALEKANQCVRNPTTLEPPNGEKHKPTDRPKVLRCHAERKRDQVVLGTRHLNKEVILKLCPLAPDVQLMLSRVKNKLLSQDLPEFLTHISKANKILVFSLKSWSGVLP